MSGWESGYSVAAFGLTATKAAYWHRSCNCGAAQLEQLFRDHLEPLGFERLPHNSPNLLVLTRSDLTSGGRVVWSEGPIFDALQALP